jgi:hypothetical protein
MNSRKTGRKLIMMWWCTVLTGVSLPAPAQQQQKDSILAVIRKVQQVYQSTGTIHCSLKYSYATESAPLVALDSLAGEITMSGNNYRMALGNTETIQTGRYTIRLFKGDKLMYITRSTAASLQQNLSPVAILDSMLTHNKYLTWRIRSEKNLETISMVFPDGLAYKKVEFTVDMLNGYVEKMAYLVRTEQLMDPAIVKGETSPAAFDKYAIVEASYDDYRKEAKADSAAFEEQTFFSRKGSEFTASQLYKDYKIITGSGNL